ncbi:MAG: hypothetical protein H8E14_18480 [Candidatus Marinimicrobia bacterium]|nr:hypothetical protein [Candidatus Neomarinimicrobiota bacterium]
MINNNNSISLVLSRTVRTPLFVALEQAAVITMLAVAVALAMVAIHAIGFPLYRFNPMHITLYWMLFRRQRTNLFVLTLAFALPIFSQLVSGHPVLLKSVAIGIELFTYGYIFNLLYLNKSQPLLFAFLVSQIFGKLTYYLMKWTFVKAGWLKDQLVATDISQQLLSAFLIGVLVVLLSKISDAKNNRMNKD